jgi:phosphomannomutase
MLIEGGYAEPGAAVMIGRDLRPSSPEIAAICMGALARAGLMPVDCGELPTPALAFYGLKMGAASLMVTGSHIPADRNGIKFYRPDGEIDKGDEQAITSWAVQLSNDTTATSVEHGSGPDHSAEATGVFLTRCNALLPPAALAGLRVGVYQHSSVAREILISILESYGAKALPLGRSESFVPVDTEAISERTCAELATWARENDLDAIVSTDGDADRPLVVDENGTLLRGDLLGVISAKFLRAQVIATPITSNSGLEAAGGIEVVRTRVGSPYVIAAMNEAVSAGRRAVVGFEANGGVLLASDFPVSVGTIGALPTRDSILPILAALNSVKEMAAPLSTVAAQYSMPIALSGRIENYPPEKSGALMTYLRGSQSNLAQFLERFGHVTATSDLDGLRVTLDDARVIHIRPSGNSPEIRCYVEARDQYAAEQLMAQGLAAVRAWTPPRSS